MGLKKALQNPFLLACQAGGSYVVIDVSFMQSDAEMKVQVMSRGEPLSSEALDSLQSRRREFLAKTIAVVMGMLGLVLIGVLLGNVVHVWKDESTGLPPAQILQGVAGAVLFVLVLRGLVAQWLSAFFVDPRSRVKVFLFPLIVWPSFCCTEFRLMT